jgi:hypothetical protein
MATPIQDLINRTTGVSRVTSGTRTRVSKRLRNAARRVSRGGQGG